MYLSRSSVTITLSRKSRNMTSSFLKDQSVFILDTAKSMYLNHHFLEVVIQKVILGQAATLYRLHLSPYSRQAVMSSSNSAKSSSDTSAIHIVSASSQARVYAGPLGAWRSSRSSATSPSGKTSSREQSTFVPGGTLSSASASATASDQGATTSATVSAPVGKQEGSSEPTDESNSHDSDEEPEIDSRIGFCDGVVSGREFNLRHRCFNGHTR